MFPSIPPFSCPCHMCVAHIHHLSSLLPQTVIDFLTINLMPHCPRCGKCFTSNQKIVRHLNQPWSSCTLLIDDLITLPQLLQPPLHNSVGPQQETDIPDMYSQIVMILVISR